jgi:hypothetical protein
MTAHGPYGTREQARADIARTRGYTDRAWRYDMLTAACADAGVRPGEFDRQTLDWLAGHTPETTQVIVGPLSRTGGEEELRAEIDILRKQVDSLETAVRRAAPVEIDLTGYRTILDGGAGR